MGRLLYLVPVLIALYFGKAVGVKKEKHADKELDNYVPAGFSTNMYRTHGGGWAENDWQ